jgi:hypothetical protein
MEDNSMKIIYLPVDERFCTRDYFLLLAESVNINVLTPNKKDLGNKKIPADTDFIKRWLLDNSEYGDILILSIDTLLHGGLIPSRINKLKYETLLEKLEILETLKSKGCKIYISTSVTRIPKYNSDDEEPIYWEFWGEKIRDLTLKISENKPNILNEYDTVYKNMNFKNDIPEWYLEDFFIRRNRNFKIISKLLDLVKLNIIDFLNITLDDNEENSLSVLESKYHEEKVLKENLQEKVSIHPGADEASLSLLSKALTDHFNVKPMFDIKYSEPEYKHLIPPYEGTPLFESLAEHIKSSGGIFVENQGDITLLVNNSDKKQHIDINNKNDYKFDDNNQNKLLNYIQQKNIKGICDIRFGNGSDDEIILKLLKKVKNWDKTNYSGWNTPGNTIGTVCAYSIIQFLASKKYLKLDTSKMKRLQAIFFIEHWGYQSNVRQELREESKKYGCNIWTLLPAEKWAIDYSKEKLNDYKEIVENNMNQIWEMEVWFPWNRSFEIGIKLEEKGDING